MISILLGPVVRFISGLAKYVAIAVGAGVVLEAMGYDVMQQIIDYIVNTVSWGLL